MFSTLLYYAVSPYGSVRVSPHNAVFNNADSVNLTCLAEGGPGNTFQWAFNGINLINEHNYRLALPFINATENGGYYTCIVMNEAGNGTETTGVFINPNIINHPSDVIVTDLYSNIYLQFDVSAFPYPEFQWFHASGDLSYAYYYVYNYFSSILCIDLYYYYHYYYICEYNPYYYYYYYCDYFHYFHRYEAPYGDYHCTATSNNVTAISETATLHSKFMFSISWCTCL